MNTDKKLVKSHLRPHWTDYPIVELGDEPQIEASVREVRLLSYDGDKRLTVIVGGVEVEIKRGYIYTRRGHLGDVPNVSRTTLRRLIKPLQSRRTAR